MTPSAERKCLIVLGMHRSGTSAISGTLKLTGFNIGKNQFLPAEDNPKGSFENANITMLNEKILDELFARWNDTLLMPEEWWKSEKFEAYSEKIDKILQKEFVDADSILIKDPRLSVLLPLYLNVFRQSAIKPVFVICVRNPFEVADSLKTRNHLSKEKSLLLWMDYQLKAEFYSRSYPRIFISYLHFLKEPFRTLKFIGKSLDLPIVINQQIKKEILAFLDPTLKHYDLSKKLPFTKQLPQLDELFQLLSKVNFRDLESHELVIADEIRSHFFSTIKFYNGLALNFEAALKIYYNDDKQSVLKAPVKFGDNELKFPIDPGHPVSRIVFKPSNSRVGLLIKKVEVENFDKISLKIDDIENNSSYKTEDGLVIFETEMPEIIINFSSPKTIAHITFFITYVAFGRITYRMALNYTKGSSENLQIENLMVRKYLIDQKNELLKIQQSLNIKNLEIEEKSRVIDNLNRSRNGLEIQIERINKSLTWRLGKALLAPMHFVYKLVKK